MQRKITDTDIDWAGVHYLLYLRDEQSGSDTARLSVFETEYSPHGGGYAAFVYIASGLGEWSQESGLYTDNPALARWFYELMYRDSDTPFARIGPESVIARFTRQGDLRRRLTFHVETATTEIEATWSALDPPFMHHGKGGKGTHYTYCLFFTAQAAQLRINGAAVPGDLYPRTDWQRLLSRSLSSCLLGREVWVALANVRHEGG